MHMYCTAKYDVAKLSIGLSDSIRLEKVRRKEIMMSKLALFTCPTRCHVGDPENPCDELILVQRVGRAFADMERVC